MVEQKVPERAITLFMRACEVAEVWPSNFVICDSLFAQIMLTANLHNYTGAVFHARVLFAQRTFLCTSQYYQ